MTQHEAYVNARKYYFQGMMVEYIMLNGAASLSVARVYWQVAADKALRYNNIAVTSSAVSA